MANLIDHLESWLGPIESGWTRDADGNPTPFPVVLFPNGPRPDSVTFATLGMNRYSFKSRGDGRHVHQELMMSVPDALRHGPIPGMLQTVAGEVQESGIAVTHGDVFGPRGALVSGSTLEALYATTPPFPEEFATYQERERRIEIVWLAPISHDEAHLVWESGAAAFDALIRDRAPDLVDIYRPSIV